MTKLGRTRSIALVAALVACNRSPKAGADASASASASPLSSAAAPDAVTVDAGAGYVSAAGELGSGDTAAGAAPTSDEDTKEETKDDDATADASAPRRSFRKASIEPEELAKIFAQVPELVRIGAEIRYFTEGDVRAIIARSHAAHEGISFVTTPIFWTPYAGVELLVATGRGKNMSFVVALWPVKGGGYRFASSFLMLADLSPVALAYDVTRRRELRWTSCWGCAGEQGFVSFRPEERKVVIVQQ